MVRKWLAGTGLLDPNLTLFTSWLTQEPNAAYLTWPKGCFHKIQMYHHHFKEGIIPGIII